MKKQIPAIILAIACIGLLIAYVNARKTIKDLQDKTAQLEDRLNGADLIAEAPATLKERAPKETARDLVSSKTASATAAAPDPTNTVASTPSEGRKMIENMVKMMENPTMNKVVEASQRGTLEALYSDLIDYLGLSGEEKDYFMDLLMHRQMAQIDYAMKAMSGSLSEEDRAVLLAKIEEASATVRTEMENFLNNDSDYEEYTYYEKTMSERMMLSQLDKDLTDTGETLSDETYRELLGIMYDERNSFDFSGNLQEQENMDMSAERFSQENVQSLANDLHSLNENICLRAQSILSEEQYSAFVSSLKSTTEMQLSQIQMAAQMFGGGN